MLAHALCLPPSIENTLGWAVNSAGKGGESEAVTEKLISEPSPWASGAPRNRMVSISIYHFRRKLALKHTYHLVDTLISNKI